LLKYSLDGEQKFGVVKRNVCYNFDKDELNYLDVAYSDEIKSHMQNNSFVLNKIESFKRLPKCVLLVRRMTQFPFDDLN
jgi:hypothetical protein